jgi:hypothetical protein
MIVTARGSNGRKGLGVIEVEQGSEAKPVGPGGGGKTAGRRRRSKRPSCETCFFGCRGLCALELGGPCATFRPDDPGGLMPPRQPALLYRESSESALAA